MGTDNTCSAVSRPPVNGGGGINSSKNGGKGGKSILLMQQRLLGNNNNSQSQPIGAVPSVPPSSATKAVNPSLPNIMNVGHHSQTSQTTIPSAISNSDAIHLHPDPSSTAAISSSSTNRPTGKSAAHLMRAQERLMQQPQLHAPPVGNNATSTAMSALSPSSTAYPPIKPIGKDIRSMTSNPSFPSEKTAQPSGSLTQQPKGKDFSTMAARSGGKDLGSMAARNGRSVGKDISAMAARATVCKDLEAMADRVQLPPNAKNNMKSNNNKNNTSKNSGASNSSTSWSLAPKGKDLSAMVARNSTNNNIGNDQVNGSSTNDFLSSTNSVTSISSAVTTKTSNRSSSSALASGPHIPTIPPISIANAPVKSGKNIAALLYKSPSPQTTSTTTQPPRPAPAPPPLHSTPLPSPSFPPPYAITQAPSASHPLQQRNAITRTHSITAQTNRHIAPSVMPCVPVQQPPAPHGLQQQLPTILNQQRPNIARKVTTSNTNSRKSIISSSQNTKNIPTAPKPAPIPLSRGTTPPKPTLIQNENLSAARLQSLLTSIDSSYVLEPSAQEHMLSLADGFLEALVRQSARLAKHRASSRVDVADLRMVLEKKWGMSLPPGFCSATASSGGASETRGTKRSRES